MATTTTLEKDDENSCDGNDFPLTQELTTTTLGNDEDETNHDNRNPMPEEETMDFAPIDNDDDDAFHNDTNDTMMPITQLMPEEEEEERHDDHSETTYHTLLPDHHSETTYHTSEQQLQPQTQPEELAIETTKEHPNNVNAPRQTNHPLAETNRHENDMEGRSVSDNFTKQVENNETEHYPKENDNVTLQPPSNTNHHAENETTTTDPTRTTTHCTTILQQAPMLTPMEETKDDDTNEIPKSSITPGKDEIKQQLHDILSETKESTTPQKEETILSSPGDETNESTIHNNQDNDAVETPNSKPVNPIVSHENSNDDDGDNPTAIVENEDSKVEPKHAESEISSSESSDDDDDELLPRKVNNEELQTPLLERRARRMATNQIRMKDLGFTVLDEKTTTPVRNKDDDDDDDEISTQHRGMLFEEEEEFSETNLEDKYPGRSSQIRLLTSIVEATIAQLQRDEEYIPAPIFIYGASGTAKTCLTRELVQGYASKKKKKKTKNTHHAVTNNVGAAYINCATLAPSSIEALAENAYQQIVPTFQLEQPKTNEDRKRKRKLKMKSPLSMGRMSGERQYDEIDEEQMEDLCEQELLRKEDDGENGQGTTKLQGTTKAPSNTRTKYARQSKSDGLPVKASTKKLTKESQTMEASYFASHGVPLAFGRSLMPFIGRNQRGCAFLILDNAERLMSMFPRVGGQKKTNYLAQLLLLPKALELQLTVIAISKNALLMNSRIGNMEAIEKSIGTLSLGVHPISIHFNAYSENETFLKILKTPENLPKIIGTQYKDSEFHRITVNAFLGSLVQNMAGLTRDVRDMIWAGRHYWPSYIEPLSEANINATMAKLEGSENMQQAILSFLDQRMMKLSQSLESRLLFLGKCNESCKYSFTKLPYLSKCLLLACFICQHNKVNQDKKLFTTTGNGKRRKQQREDDSEMGAFTSWDENALRVLRPKAFPLERMLSVFVNIVALHDGQNLTSEYDPGATTRSFLSSLGHSVFFETIGRLRLDGLLRELPSKEDIQLSNPMYFCDLERDDANSLAESISFPLEEYLISGS